MSIRAVAIVAQFIPESHHVNERICVSFLKIAGKSQCYGLRGEKRSSETTHLALR